MRRWTIGLGLLAVIGCGDGEGDPARFGGETTNTLPPSTGGDASTAAPPGASRDAGIGAPPPQAGRAADADGADSNDQYEAVGTNPFVHTADDPFSTFGADVDTASYDIFLRDVEEYGTLPHPASVRLEEYVNAFDYDYATPELGDEVPFMIDLAATQHPMGRQLAQLRVGITAADPPAVRKLPSNIVYLIDVSGSMQSDNKLPLVKELVIASLDALEHDDRVSIVTYAGATRVALPPTEAREHEAIASVIRDLESGGGTAGGEGIQLAYQQAEAGFIDDGFNHVVLCTDGDFNIGIRDTTELVNLIEEKRRTGVTLTALGFGRGNLNDAMMERVSNAGNGIYTVIRNSDHAAEYVQEDMLRTIHHVASDMKLQVEFNPEHVVAYRLLGYENRAIADHQFRMDAETADEAGEVGAGLRVTALYELVLAGQSIPEITGQASAGEAEAGETTETESEVIEPELPEPEITAEELVRVKVRWRELHAPEDGESSETFESILVADALGGIDDADLDTQWAAAVAAFAEILKGSPYADESDLDAIETLVRAQSMRDDDRADFVRAFETAREMLP